MAGTADDPVRVTSYKDDSVGGDTNGDGPSVGQASDYGTAIQIASVNKSDNPDPAAATVTVSHLVASYGYSAIGEQPQYHWYFGYFATNNAEVTVTDSEITHFPNGIYLSGGNPQTGHLNIEDSTFTDITNTAIYSGESSTTVGSSVFNTGGGEGVAIRSAVAEVRSSEFHTAGGQGLTIQSESPVVESSMFDTEGGRALSVTGDVTGVALSGADANQWIGTDGTAARRGDI